MSPTGEPAPAVVTDAFTVEVPGFSGPFRLLAELILDQKIDVCDVAIGGVTDRYLAHAKEAERWSLEEATWFLAICATLLELKVARLTPKRVEPDEEDLVGASPDLAYARSLELRAFRTVTVGLGRRLEDEAGYFTRDIGPGSEFSHLYPDPMRSITADALARTAGQLLRSPPMVDLSHVTPVLYTMAEAMTMVADRITGIDGGQASFRQLVADCRERMDVVMRFLALLELYREGKVELQQAETFGEIDVEWEG